MPLFLDRHDAPGATAVEIAAAHALDVNVQDRHGVRYVTYWFDDAAGKVFCLAEGPDRAALETVHREAHGLVADDIIEVGDGPINAFLGPLPQHPPGEAYRSLGVARVGAERGDERGVAGGGPGPHGDAGHGYAALAHRSLTAGGARRAARGLARQDQAGRAPAVSER